MNTTAKPRPRRVPASAVGLAKLWGADRPIRPPKREFADATAGDPLPALGSAPLVPAAGEAFDAAELAARLADYADRARRRLPLSGGTDDAAPHEDTRGACWGCGRRPTPRRAGARAMPAKARGWVVSSLPGYRHLREVWCPGCAAELKGGAA